MNRKGQIAFVMMPVLALALFIGALFAMVSFKGELNFQSEELFRLSERLDFNYDYVVRQGELIASEVKETCLECSDSELEEKFIEISREREEMFRHLGAGNFYGQIRNEKFEINNGKVVVEDLFVEARMGENMMRREFSLKINVANQ